MERKNGGRGGFSAGDADEKSIGAATLRLARSAEARHDGAPERPVGGPC